MYDREADPKCQGQYLTPLGLVDAPFSRIGSHRYVWLFRCKQMYCSKLRRCRAKHDPWHSSCFSIKRMLHMSVQENDDGSVVRLSGRLEGDFVAEAGRVCLSAAAPLLIDATELRDAGADGIALLAELLTQGPYDGDPDRIWRPATLGLEPLSVAFRGTPT